MRFLGKYELLEQHTVGTVETFSAHPIGGSELFLVHLFSLPALTKASPTNRDLLDYLERICPPALGSVLDGGQYDDGSQAYIVTKFPRDPDALGNWVEAYKAMPKSVPKPVSQPRRNLSDAPAREPWLDEIPRAQSPPPPIAEKPAGDFTRAFQAFGADRVPAKPPSPEDDGAHRAPRAARPVPERSLLNSESRPESRRPAPGNLTEQLAGLGEGAQLPTSRLPVQPPVAPRNIGPKEEPKFEPRREPVVEPVQGRKADAWADHPEPPAEVSREPARPGEFTQFFRSPFAAPQPADPLPIPMPDLVNPPAPARSDFTQLFGRSSGASLAPLAPEPLLEPPGQSERSNYTEIFGNARPAPNEPPVPQWMPDQPAELTEKGDRAGDYFISNTNALPISPSMRDGEPVFRSGTPLGGPRFGTKQDEGATRVFKAPVQEQAPEPTPVPEGESQYTRIIKGPKRESAGLSASSGTQGPPPSPGGMKLPLPLPNVSVAMPAMSMPTIGPSGVGAPQVRMPSATLSAPPSPVLPPLQVPPLSMVPPKLPPGPKLPVLKKPGNWTSYIPLIVILHLIFVAAVGLVLYFVYRP